MVPARTRAGKSGSSGPACFWASTTALLPSRPPKKSLAFYRGLPGLHTAFAGTNEGETQERLDGVAGAVVRITGLQAAAPEGPGIEFLEYEKPAVGRPAAGIRADDAAHAHLTLVVDSLQEILAAPEVQRLSASAIPLSRKVCSASIVDPDGHVLVLEEKTLPPSSSACGTEMSAEPR